MSLTFLKTFLLYLRFLLFIYLLLGWFCFLAFFDGFPCFSGIGFFLLFSSHSPDLYFLYKVLRATCLINLIIISISDHKCPIYNVMYLKFGLSSKLSLVLRGATGFSLFTFLLRSNFLVKVSVKSNIRK